MPRSSFQDFRSGRATDARARRAVELTGQALATGFVGLTNLHDPNVITLAVMAPDLRAAAPEAFDRAYNRGLMNFRHQDPHPILDGIHSQDGPIGVRSASASRNRPVPLRSPAGTRRVVAWRCDDLVPSESSK